MSSNEILALVQSGRVVSPSGTIAMVKFADLRKESPKLPDETNAEWNKRIGDAMAAHCRKARIAAPVVAAGLVERGLYMAGAKVMRDSDGNLTGVDLRMRQEKTLAVKVGKASQVAALTAQIRELTAQLESVKAPVINV
jgi:hypothetical protein